MNMGSAIAASGLGLKAEHYREVLAMRPELGFFEIHAENYMGRGGPPHRYLEAIRRDYDVSLHGVGLSVGGPQPLDRAHLARLKELERRYRPFLFSEHLAWSTHVDGYLADLLPLPYTEATLARVCSHIDEAQEFMGRQMLLENPASYLGFEESTHAEPQFLAAVVARTGCGLLLDLNNVFVSARNLGSDPAAYLDSFPLASVQEIHLAGHELRRDPQGLSLLIDAHGAEIAADVWELYGRVIGQTGPLPSLIERDNNVPPFPELLAEAHKAAAIMAAAAARAA